MYATYNNTLHKAIRQGSGLGEVIPTNHWLQKKTPTMIIIMNSQPQHNCELIKSLDP